MAGWDDERDALILKLRDESGLSASQIAARVPFTTTRSAVCGRLWRLDGGVDGPRSKHSKRPRVFNPNPNRLRTGRWDDDLFEPWAVRKARLAYERATRPS